MTHDAAVPNPFAWWSSLAPQYLMQSINPGMVIGGVVQVTHHNSTAPETEREVVAKHSYGRQIGRIMEALLALMEGQPADDPRFADFKKLATEVKQIKARAEMKPAERLHAELKDLEKSDPVGYQRLRRLLIDA